MITTSRTRVWLRALGLTGRRFHALTYSGEKAVRRAPPIARDVLESGKSFFGSDSRGSCHAIPLARAGVRVAECAEAELRLDTTNRPVAWTIGQRIVLHGRPLRTHRPAQ